jgi:hypothetical protein
MGKSKALETALNNKLLGSHEHLKKCIFSLTPLYIPTVRPIDRSTLHGASAIVFPLGEPEFGRA